VNGVNGLPRSVSRDGMNGRSGGEGRAVDAEAALEAIGVGDMAALEWLYRELRVPVLAAALAITADRGLADDVLQETFLRVYTHARTYRPGSRPRAWLLTGPTIRLAAPRTSADPDG
jgi:hypothetical protein